MSDWDAVKTKVESAGGVVTVTMEELRDASGAGKLGVHVRGEISRTLASMGFGHVPTELPSYQQELVRIYKRGTPIGDLIETVLTPGGQNDQKLSERFAESGPDYAAMVAKIREFVAE